MHRSSVYKSTTTGNRKVAFSAPIWSGAPGKEGRACQGVLVMAFDVGVLFRSIAAAARSGVHHAARAAGGVVARSTL